MNERIVVVSNILQEGTKVEVVINFEELIKKKLLPIWGKDTRIEFMHKKMSENIVQMRLPLDAIILENKGIFSMGEDYSITVDRVTTIRKYPELIDPLKMLNT